MRLSTKIRYGYRLMVELAMHWGEPAVALKEISERQNISLLYLRQIIMSLEAAGLVKSHRGSKGGYALARAPESIDLIEITRALEGPMALVECIDDPGACERSEWCATRLLWKQMTEQIEKVFSSQTLAGLTSKQIKFEKSKPVATD